MKFLKGMLYLENDSDDKYQNEISGNMDFNQKVLKINVIAFG